MRVPALLLAVLAAPGCLSAWDALDRGPLDVEVSPRAFDRVSARWVASLTSGCGMCGPSEGGFASEPETFTLFLFEDGRLLLVERNHHPETDGLVVHEGVTYDRQQLADLLRTVRPEGDDAWVVRVRTAAAEAPPRLAERLGARWALDDGSTACTDHGETHLYAPREGDVRRQTTTCVEEGSPMHAYAATMWRLVQGTRERGVVQGA